MRQLSGIVLFLAAYFVLLSFVFRDYTYVNTRKLLFQNRALNRSSLPSISKKNLYFKEAFRLSDTKGGTALKMNEREALYKIPYMWGGDIKNYIPGLDCTGFFHGLMHYNGEIGYKKRFDSYSLFKLLKRRKDYELIYDAKFSENQTEYNSLKINDIILWPSGVSDGKNLPGPIMGHVGIVSTIIDSIPHVTHYVDSERHNPYDIIGPTGQGINTMRVDSFITFKKRGRLIIFREK